MGRRQKGKSKKRLRSWHHLPNQDRIYRRNAAKLDQALNGGNDGSGTGHGPDNVRGEQHSERDKPARKSTRGKEQH